RHISGLPEARAAAGRTGGGHRAGGIAKLSERGKANLPRRSYHEPPSASTCPAGGMPVVGACPTAGLPEPFSAMITLKLPDGSTRQVAPGTRPRDVAESIGKRLAQAAVAAKVNGEVVDLNRELPPEPAEVSFE